MGLTPEHLAAHLVEALLGSLDAKHVLAVCAQGLGELLSASRVTIAFSSPQAWASRPPLEWTADEPDPALDNLSLKLLNELAPLASALHIPLLIEDTASDPRLRSERSTIEALGIRSLIIGAARNNERPLAYIVLSSNDETVRWNRDALELVSYISRIVGLHLSNCLERHPLPGPAVPGNAHEEVGAAEERYRRLVEHSDAVIFNTDPEHRLTFISRRALDFFGIPPAELLDNGGAEWGSLIHPDDRVAVQHSLRELERKPASLDLEFRVINKATGRIRWLLTKLVPVRAADSTIRGWDGFGIEITVRKEAQEALDAQSKKVRALYTVSSAIRGFLDPANIASRGLAALCEATGAEAGLCYLYPSAHGDTLALVAHHGFSAGFAEREDSNSSLHSLSTYVAENGQSVVVPDIRMDPRASKSLADEEGIRSTLLVPISVEDETLGTLGLFNREVSRFDGGDVMLVAAAANQIGLAARQANLFSLYRKQARNLTALYRLSHELSGFLSLEEIFQKAFEVIRDELGLKRLWLGLLNETGTRIIGQAAYGPGWKRRLVEINVEIKGRDHPIAQVITARKAMMIDDPEKVLSEFGVKRFFSRFAINAVGLVPLISGGQVLGALAFQPGSEEPQQTEEEIALLSSLASEIAASLLAKRLEERIGEGEKMRSTGLLAAGIAHNFNNLLQAILGQASLLEMQSGPSSEVSRAATIINDSATKGASLVRQLMSFANLEEPSTEVCDINVVIERAASQLNRQLTGNQQLTLLLSESLPQAQADPRQVLRILTTLVTNAHEAMDENGTVHLFTDCIIVDRKSPHYEVPYGQYIRIGVRDNGKGMDADEKRRCFEPFYTTKNVDPSSGLSLSGAGLGLAAAYALARKNGGRLAVDSRKGHGSLFTLYVPVVGGPSARKGDQSRNAPASMGTSEERLEVEIEAPDPEEQPDGHGKPLPPGFRRRKPPQVKDAVRRTEPMPGKE